MRTAVTIHLGYSLGKGRMHGHYNAGGILFGNYRVPQQSGPRQNSLWQGFHSNQDPDRILFGKGSTAISTQTGLFLARVQQQSGPRHDCFWQGFHNNQDPDRIVFGKGSTAIRTQTEFCLQQFHKNQDSDRVCLQGTVSRQDSDW